MFKIEQDAKALQECTFTCAHTYTCNVYKYKKKCAPLHTHIQVYMYVHTYTDIPYVKENTQDSWGTLLSPTLLCTFLCTFLCTLLCTLLCILLCTLLDVLLDRIRGIPPCLRLCGASRMDPSGFSVPPPRPLDQTHPHMHTRTHT